MGHYVFKLPDVGEGTAEAEIVAWHVKIGDRVEEDQNLVDVMTDKATVEMTSPVTGTILALHGEPGEMAPVGAPLVELEVEGAGDSVPVATPATDEAAVQADDASTSHEKKPPREKKPGIAAVASATVAAAPGAPPKGARSQRQIAQRAPAFAVRTLGARPLASPAVRNRARELGVALQFVPGTGPAGRISQDDLDAFVADGGTQGTQHARRPRSPARDVVEEVKIIGLRRKIAEKMQDAKRRIPHYAYIEEVDMTALETLRAHLNAGKAEDQPKLTLLPFLIRALVRALPEFPQINARFDDDAGIVHRHSAVHAGIATQTVNGLIVPVVKHAEARDVWDLAAEIARLAALTREGKASREELTGSTITITSLGALGGVATTPVINHPEVAIIGPNAIIERPVVRDGQIVIRKMMNLSSSFDHRVVDGFDAASFIQRVKTMLENPATIFMD
ncbi:MAG: 2-oxo acid dehydrogenase subunit E2 [Alphaproteobacteria bacterium]|nr:2-oxo acid dehydrogenase subunit E2 [Alphaproteobacteria bacterium]